MSFDLTKDCRLIQVTADSKIDDFDCGNSDLNEFFIKDAINYHEQLLAESFFFIERTTNSVVCAFSLSNDSVKTIDLPNNRKKKIRSGIPREKHVKSFPATLIGRLGVSIAFGRMGLGTQLLDFIKFSCLLEVGNRSRFLIVDAYNQTEVVKFYESNGFQFLFGSEDQEKEYFEVESSSILRTRFMYFDLLPFKLASNGLF
jgi:ribosomal protein S18 acetylase RimI-like enzyme